MKNKKRLFIICFSAIIMLSTCGCGGGNQSGTSLTTSENESSIFDKNMYYDEDITPNGEAAYDGEITVSSLKSTDGGKAYLDVNGNPFLMLGAQLRTDFFLQLNKVGLAGLDDYFKLASKLNITVIQVPVCWRDIEPQKGKYTAECVKAFIDYCNKYNFKLELLWFGSYMCGYSVEGYVPDYVMNDPETYPSYSDYSFQGWLGKHWFLRADTAALTARESLAVEYLMESVWEYDRYNGGRRTVVGVQIENEPDMLATRHNELHGYTQAQIWGDMVKHLSALGCAVKNSKYKCYTRVNMTTDTDYAQRFEDVCETDGIDFAGLDPYTDSLASLNTYINELTSVSGNFPHIAENGGEYANTDQMMLKCFKSGVGYEVFEVITTDHPYLVDWTLRGLYNPDFTKKEHTDNVIAANKLYKDAYVDLVLGETQNFLAFNLVANGGMNKLTETQSTDSVTVKWTTAERGMAFAVERGGYLTLGSTKADKVEITGNISNGEIGIYSMSGKWLKIKSVNTASNGFTLEAGAVYRFKIGV